MYLGIDIGGTKTLLCTVSQEGKIQDREKFETPQDYKEFLDALRTALQKFDLKDVVGIGIGAPGHIDREHNAVFSLGNLPWVNVPIVADVTAMTSKPASIENDAKVAGLYQAISLQEKYSRVLYVTISTGIGLGMTINGLIDINVSDMGGKGMIFEHNGQLVPWERYASGKAIFTEFGQRASDITDPGIWQEVSRRLVPGFTQLITLLSPDAISIGGGVGAHYDKFQHIFEPLLESYLADHITKPHILQAKDAEDAVIYGCYALAKQSYDK